MKQEARDITVLDSRAANRYEARVNGQIAGFAQYRRQGNRSTFTHTEVDPLFEGHGIGSAIVRAALDGARKEQLEVVPLCPFMRDYITGHPEYLDLVEPAHREQVRSSRS